MRRGSLMCRRKKRKSSREEGYVVRYSFVERRRRGLDRFGGQENRRATMYPRRIVRYTNIITISASFRLPPYPIDNITSEKKQNSLLIHPRRNTPHPPLPSDLPISHRFPLPRVIPPHMAGFGARHDVCGGDGGWCFRGSGGGGGGVGREEG